MQRIKPKDENDYPWYIRLLFKMQKKKYHKVLESSKLWARSPRVFITLSAFFGALERKSSPLTPELRTLIIVRVSQINQCEFCIDLNSARLLSLDPESSKLKHLSNYFESPLYTEGEHAALAYTDAITYSNQEVTDTLFSRLKKTFSDDEIIELTAVISFQNMSTKFNNALNIPSQGFCKVPPAL